MPGMDGWQMAAAIKADRLIRNIPLIAVSAMEERMEKPRLAAAGFAAGLTKPLKQSRLFDAIASAILASDPGSEPSAKTDLPTPAIDSTPKGIRILVAEDNEVNQYVARKLLASNGYECDIVCNGRLAVSAAARRHYNLILMDCAMPEMDGFEATLHIRAAEVSAGGSRHVPIIALTAEAVRGDREKCRDAGMDEYVSKPINPDDLFSKIRLLTANPPQTADRVDASGLTAAPAVKPPSPIDVPALLARSMNDAGFATETLVRFKAQVAKDLDLLQKSVAARAIPDAARLAHSLKGIAGHIGAASLRDTAARIESLGNAADVAQIESTLAELKTEIDRCVESIPDAVRQLGATSNA
jgi:CheY-like chemotaxis protein